MKRKVIIILNILLIIGCSKSETQKNIAEMESVNDHVKNEILNLESLRQKPMEEVIKNTFSYEVPIRVNEKEKGYYLGFIVFEKNGEIVSGYDGGAPLNFSIDSIKYTDDKMTLLMKGGYFEENKITKNIELLSADSIEVVVYKKEFIDNIINYVNGNSDSRRITTFGTFVE